MYDGHMMKTMGEPSKRSLDVIYDMDRCMALVLDSVSAIRLLCLESMSRLLLSIPLIVLSDVERA